MQLSILLLPALMLAALLQPGSTKALSREQISPVSYKLELIRRMPHENKPFTQGLEFTSDGKYLVETSGAYPEGTKSYVRLLDPATGKTIKTISDGIDDTFAEGIVQSPENGHWFASTYIDHKAVEYTPDFQFVAHHHYPWMGYGLTRTADGTAFLATNSSEYLMTLQKGTFAIQDAKVIRCMGKEIKNLNELEMVDDFMDSGPTLLGNVYLSRLVLALDPATAQCKGVFHLESLGGKLQSESAGYHAANGLAWVKGSGTLIATGKNWDEMFEVRPVPDTSNEAASMLSSFVGIAHPSLLEEGTHWLEVSAAADSSTSFLEQGKEGRTHNNILRS